MTMIEPQAEIERMRAIMMQRHRIQELQGSVLEEQERMNVFREQLREVNERLHKGVKAVRIIVEGILNNYEVLLGDRGYESSSVGNVSESEPIEDGEGSGSVAGHEELNQRL